MKCRATRTDRKTKKHFCKRQQGHKSMHACRTSGSNYQWVNKSRK